MRSYRSLVTLVVASTLFLALPASAQEGSTTTVTGFGITTPYPSVAVEAGDQASFDLAVVAPEPTPVSLETANLPDGWTAVFRGGGFEIDGATAGPVAPDVTVDVTVPVDAPEGVYELGVVAESSSASTRLVLQVRVAAQAGGEVTLTPDFPGLRVAAGEAATFTVDLRNDTPSDLEFELDASGPAGWEVNAEPSSEPQATTIQVGSGSSTTINVAATSPPRAEAGQYSIAVQATAADTDVQTEMIVEVVGSYSMDLTTIDQRLSTDLSADGSTDIQLVVTNTGTAPIVGVQMDATPPSGWDVTFAQPVLAQVDAGATVDVTATVTPSQDAVAGDYVVTFSADSDDASSTMDIRTTVNPSALWGFVGIALIALTLAGLAWVFRRFGRR